MAVSLFVAGDVVPQYNQATPSCEGNSIFKEIKPFVSKADFSVVNLEAPVTDDAPTPISKYGPCLRTTSSTIELLKGVGFAVFTLANNHFFDQGQKGVCNTINACNGLNIKTVGGGVNLTVRRVGHYGLKRMENAL